MRSAAASRVEGPEVLSPPNEHATPRATRGSWPMNERNFIFLLFCATLATGCLQPVDSSASSSSAVSGGSAAPAPCNGKQPFSLDTDPSGQTIVCPAADGGDIPVALAPFPVFLDGGATSTNPCDLLGERSHAIREAYCAPCHNPPQSMGSFNFCLDDSELMTAYSQNAIDPGDRQASSHVGPRGSRQFLSVPPRGHREHAPSRRHASTSSQRCLRAPRVDHQLSGWSPAGGSELRCRFRNG